MVDPAGAVLRELAAGVFPAGHHTVDWDGRDDAGQPAALRRLPGAPVGDQGLVGTQKLMLLK